MIIAFGRFLLRRPWRLAVALLLLVGPPIGLALLDVDRSWQQTVRVVGTSALGLLYLGIAYWNAKSSWRSFAHGVELHSSRCTHVDDEEDVVEHIGATLGVGQVLCTGVLLIATLAAAWLFESRSDVNLFGRQVLFTVAVCAATANDAYWLMATPTVLARLLGPARRLTVAWFDPAGEPSQARFAQTFAWAGLKASVGLTILTIGLTRLTPDARQDSVVRAGTLVALLVVGYVVGYPFVILVRRMQDDREQVLVELRHALDGQARFEESDLFSTYRFIVDRGVLRGQGLVFLQTVSAIALSLLPLTGIGRAG